jgi:hypothetical protein
MDRESPLTEFTATPVRFAEFCKGPVWKAFPLQIKLALCTSEGPNGTRRSI